MTALILVDIQNDFLPTGSLPVKQGDQIIPVVNKLIDEFDLVVASKDWHPKNHGSFASTHEKKPGDVIELEGLDQILWPDHCVQDSEGSEFVKGLKTDKIYKIIYKGTEENIDSYSAFFDNGHRKKTELDDFLKKEGVNTVYIAGLAADYCVKFTALDAVNLGYKTFVVKDATRAVEDIDDALKDLKANGVQIVTSESVL
jgi:nicotinamidase/pyrazinamidase